MTLKVPLFHPVWEWQELSLTKNSPADFLSGSAVENPPADAGSMDLVPGLGRTPGEEMVTHSSIHAWKILWTEEPGKLQAGAGGGHKESDRTEHTNTNKNSPNYDSRSGDCEDGGGLKKVKRNQFKRIN